MNEWSMGVESERSLPVHCSLDLISTANSLNSAAVKVMYIIINNERGLSILLNKEPAFKCIFYDRKSYLSVTLQSGCWNRKVYSPLTCDCKPFEIGLPFKSLKERSILSILIPSCMWVMLSIITSKARWSYTGQTHEWAETMAAGFTS